MLPFGRWLDCLEKSRLAIGDLVPFAEYLDSFSRHFFTTFQSKRDSISIAGLKDTKKR